jgi:hypothetical protein
MSGSRSDHLTSAENIPVPDTRLGGSQLWPEYSGVSVYPQLGARVILTEVSLPKRINYGAYLRPPQRPLQEISSSVLAIQLQTEHVISSCVPNQF